jgi:hypothetical protein
MLQLNDSVILQNRSFWIQFSKVKRQMNVFSNPFNIVVLTTLNANNTRVVLISWSSNAEVSLYWATHYNGTISKQFLQKEGEMRLIRFHCPEDNVRPGDRGVLCKACGEGTAKSVRQYCGRKKL